MVVLGNGERDQLLQYQQLAPRNKVERVAQQHRVKNTGLARGKMLGSQHLDIVGIACSNCGFALRNRMSLVMATISVDASQAAQWSIACMPYNLIEFRRKLSFLTSIIKPTSLITDHFKLLSGSVT